jgi:peptidoglycan hydrolase CwlO-like protein
VDVSIWVPIIVAIIASAPGLLAYASARRRNQGDEQTKSTQSSIEGFSKLVTHLQKQVDTDREQYEERVEVLETGCQKKIAELQAQVTALQKRVAELEGRSDDG